MSDEPENIEETPAAESAPEETTVEAAMESQIADDHAAAAAEASVEADPELVDEERDAENQGDAQAAAEADAGAQADVDAAVAADAEAATLASTVDEDAEISAPADEAPAADTASESAPARSGRTRQRAVPVRKRDQKRDPNAPKPVVRAQAKYVRSSARKARLVCDNFRGKSVEEARAILAVTPRHVARDWSKLLESAVANAEHNHELVGEDLIVKAVLADEGPTIKRFRPRAQGRATKIRKRTSHLTILLTPKD